MTARRLMRPPRRRRIAIAARQALTEAGEHLVRGEVAQRGELGHGDRLLAVARRSGCHVADAAADVGHVEHRHVHRHDADDADARCPPSSASPDCRALVDIRRRSRRRPSRSAAARVGATGRAVAHRVAVARSCAGRRSRARIDTTGSGDERAARRPCHAVEKDSRPHERPRATARAARPPGCSRRARIAGRTGSVGERLVESPLLLVAGAVVAFGGVEVSEHSSADARGEQLAKLATSSHACPRAIIPVSIARCQGRPVRAHARCRGDRRASALGSRGAAASISSRRSGVNTTIGRVIPPRRSSSPSVDGRDAEAPRIESSSAQRDAHRAESVCVGLDHRQERHAGTRRDARSVAQQRAEVDLDPGACHEACIALSIRGSGSIPDPRRAMQAKPTLEDTLSLMRDLRARCEWDAAQTHESLRPYLIEEAYEVDDAIRAGNDRDAARGARRPAAPGALPLRRRRGTRRVRLRTTSPNVSSRR